MKYVLGVFMMISLLAKSQISENFESGSIITWYQFPGDRWELSEEKPVNGLFSLHHSYDNDIAGNDRISFMHNLLCMDSANTSWSFKIKHGYSPSSVNNWNVYFAVNNNAANMSSNGDIQGYVLGINLKASDDIVKVWKIKDGDITVLMNSGFNWEERVKTNQPVGFQIERNMNGNWKVKIDTLLSGMYYESGDFNDSEFINSMFFGINYSYSSSQDMKLWFDDLHINGFFYKDDRAPEIDTLRVINERIIELEFSEPVDEFACMNISNYKINNENWVIDSIVFLAGNKIQMHFGAKLENEVSYQLSVSNISDVWGNTMQNQIISFFYYKVKPFDIVINEILYYPYAGGSEFIELFNRTEFVINLKDFFIASLNPDNYDIKSSCPIIQEDYNFYPNEYVVLTKDIPGIVSYYIIEDTTDFIEIRKMPSLTNSEGQVALYDNFMNKLDEVYYSDEMHFALLNSTNGISLERISPDDHSLKESNWHSASENAGFATPGYQNSQFKNSTYSSRFNIEPKIFSPNNDGHNDFIMISYVFNEPGFVANIFIYDSRGRFVRSICNNELLGISGSYIWDGVDDNNQIAKTGIYLVYIEYFDLKGIVNKEKRTCVLSPL